MRITYDARADAAYITLAEVARPTVRTHPCDPSEIDAMINLDFDDEGRLVGIEVMDASARLPRDLLE